MMAHFLLLLKLLLYVNYNARFADRLVKLQLHDYTEYFCKILFAEDNLKFSKHS